MDTFFEQLIRIKLNGKAKLIITLIILVDVLIVAALILFGLIFAPAIVLLIVIAAIYGAYKLISLLVIEYEYIYTNGELDVDKIVAQNTRKRMVSIKCSEVEKFGEYKGQTAPGSVKNTFVFCNPDSEGQVYLIAKDRNLGNVMMVLAPNDRLREEIEKAIPRIAK